MVRFTPESGHARCNQRCLLWANKRPCRDASFKLKRPPTEAALFLIVSLEGVFYIPSKINVRDLVDFVRISLTFLCSGELYQACAFSALSKRMMRSRFGATPSKPVIFRRGDNRAPNFRVELRLVTRRTGREWIAQLDRRKSTDCQLA
jgi:hypothetical protein